MTACATKSASRWYLVIWLTNHELGLEYSSSDHLSAVLLFALLAQPLDVLPVRHRGESCASYRRGGICCFTAEMVSGEPTLDPQTALLQDVSQFVRQ